MLLRYGSIRVACNLQHGDWPAWEFGWLTETIAGGRPHSHATNNDPGLSVLIAIGSFFSFYVAV